MGITFTLPVPLRNQLGEVTSDGMPAENDHYDCVATSLADALSYFLKTPYNGDQIKDIVYGQGYTGGMAASRYVAYCAGLGIALEAINGTQDQLLAALHREVHAGHPCLVTMPSMWGSAPSQAGWDPVHPVGWTHVGLACGDGAGMLRVMNPWGGFWHDGTDDYWRSRLCYGQVWRVAPKVASMAWHIQSNGWAKDDHGHTAGPGIVSGLQAAGWMGVDASADETPYDGEGSMYLPLANKHVVSWSKAGGTQIDQAGPILMQLEDGIRALRADNSILKGLLDAARNATPPADPVAAKALAAVQYLKAALGEV